MNYWTYLGNINNETKDSSPINIGNSVINYLILTNKSNVAVTINVTVKEPDSNAINISPLNQQLAVGECYTDRNIIVMDRSIISVQSDGNVDFYFGVMNDNSPISY
jgi:hypothetical protein